MAIEYSSDKGHKPFVYEQEHTYENPSFNQAPKCSEKRRFPNCLRWRHSARSTRAERGFFIHLKSRLLPVHFSRNSSIGRSQSISQLDQISIVISHREGDIRWRNDRGACD